MKAGAARIDITPAKDIWMAGMLRAHPSEGIHDPISACALVMSNDEDLNQSCAIVSVDVCELDESLTSTVRRATAKQVGIPAEYVTIAAKHIHSGPVTSRSDEYAQVGQLEIEYTRKLADYLIKGIKVAAGNMKRVKAGCASGRESTISQYRRLLADDDRVVMNWEPYPREHIVRPLGEIDPEVGVLKVVDMDDRTVCLLFNHAGHPNILSGDNYLISAEYPGFAEKVLEREFGGVAMFVNGAQGTMDIDGSGPRDWAEVERVGRKLAQAAGETAHGIEPAENVTLRCASIRYGLPARKITGEQLAWAEEILRQTGGKIEPVADGVGDDFKAVLYKKLHEKQNRDIPVEQVCIALNDTALVSFPGELYTEIGMRIKASSPFRRTYVLGLANGSVGYVPTAKAIREGGYSEDVRKVDVHAEDVVLTHSLLLLNQVHRAPLSKHKS